MYKPNKRLLILSGKRFLAYDKSVTSVMDMTTNTTLLLRTADFAAKKHQDQRRKGENALPYINHPIGVANLAASLGGVTDIVILQVR